MKTKIMMLLAAMLLSAGAFAQSENNEPLKGDVNGDGVVDVADIAAIIEIMKNGGGTGEQTTYYWYIGKDKPQALPTSSTTLAKNNEPGWRLIGTSKPTAGTLLYDAGPIGSAIYVNTIFDYYYFAINSDVNLAIYDSLGNESTRFITTPEVSNGINIYKTTFTNDKFNAIVKVK